MTKALLREYRKVRRAGLACIVGESARVSLSIARTLLQWRELEAAGYVQIITRADEFPDTSHLDDLPQAKRAHEREKIDRDGVWVVLTQYRTDPDRGRWVTADSIGNCMGYDDPSNPFDNTYVPDLMQSAVDQLKQALKGRFCSHCGHRN